MIINELNINKFINGSIMDCSCKGVTEIKFIPESITTLICYNNQLTYLPPLPSGLTKLYCYTNQLTVLPTLPCGLIVLWSNNNKLTNEPTNPLSEWIKQHNKSINRSNRLKQLLNN